MTHEEVQRWIDAYIAAWRAYDERLIGDLFTDDAEYRFFPADPPYVGREAIVESWVRPTGFASARDEPGRWEAEYTPWSIVDRGRAVIVRWSRY